MLTGLWVHRRGTAFIALAVLLIGGPARVAHTCCNLIPGTAETFNARLWATNRPFAAPGETLEVLTRPCDVGTSGIMPLATDHVVTLVFTPPNGPKNAVVLTADADCATTIAPKLAACRAQLGGGTVLCAPAAQSGLAVVARDDGPHLSFRFPDTDPQCLGGDNAGLPCFTANDCPNGTCDPSNDNRTLD